MKKVLTIVMMAIMTIASFTSCSHEHEHENKVYVGDIYNKCGEGWTDYQELIIRNYAKSLNPELSIDSLATKVSTFMVEKGILKCGFTISTSKSPCLRIGPDEIKVLGGYYETPYYEQEELIDTLNKRIYYLENNLADITADYNEVKSWLNTLLHQKENQPNNDSNDTGNDTDKSNSTSDILGAVAYGLSMHNTLSKYY
jgi:hypothetical protein